MHHVRSTPIAGAISVLALAPALARPPPAEPSSAPVEPPRATSEPLPANRRFPDLDAYLAYLRERAPMDGAWYREVRPGIYRLETGNLRLPDGEPKRTFTREELERKFGFSR